MRLIDNFHFKNLLALPLTGGLLIWLSHTGVIDFRLTELFFDASRGRFPFRETLLLARLGHDGLKWLVVGVWLTSLGAALLSVRMDYLRTLRAPLFWLTLMLPISALSVAALKAASSHSCPWDLALYGGSAQWFSLLGPESAIPGPGHCWPGGHASGGFALISGYFAFRDHRPGWSRCLLVAGLVLGSAMSLLQVIRGAHFLSHNLWSLWIVWVVCSIAYFFTQGLSDMLGTTRNVAG
jgi:membrane-associated PAP2 superfamily phosphatase